MSELLLDGTGKMVNTTAVEGEAGLHLGELRTVPEVACRIDEAAEAHTFACSGPCWLHMHHIAEHADALSDVSGHIAGGYARW